jgi:hypothetical protein
VLVTLVDKYFPKNILITIEKLVRYKTRWPKTYDLLRNKEDI